MFNTKYSEYFSLRNLCGDELFVNSEVQGIYTAND